MNKHIPVFNHSELDFKGKSFRCLGEWNPHLPYVNNEYCQDFVSYDNKLWACMEDCIGITPCKNTCKWELAVKGEKGTPGKEIITIYESSSYSDEEYSYTTLTIVYSNGTDEQVTFKTALAKGVPGPKGEQGIPGKDGANGKSPILKIEEGFLYYSFGDDIWVNIGPISESKLLWNEV